jgi:hypothetical protein
MRKFIVWFSCVIAFSCLRCAGAWAQPVLDPLEAHLEEARAATHNLEAYHDTDREPSSYDDYCEANDVYNQLEHDFDAAIASGDVLAANALAPALDDLGEELGFDEYLFDEYGYDEEDSCSCEPFDWVFGPHTGFVEVYGGWSNYMSSPGDSAGYSSGTSWGGAAGITVPFPQQNTYGVFKFSGYDNSGSTQIFGPSSPDRTRSPWVATADAGVGIRFKTIPINVELSAGVAVGDVEIQSLMPTVRKTLVGPTFDAEVGYRISQKLTAFVNWRVVDFENPTFNLGPGVAFKDNQIDYMTTFGARWELGSTVH